MRWDRNVNLEWDVYGYFKTHLAEHGKEFKKRELKTLLKWVLQNSPSAVNPGGALPAPVGLSSDYHIFSSSFWDHIGVKLYDLTTRRDSIALRLLPTFWVILEALKD